MAAIDEVINSLKPEELDLLNSDPHMLSAFKAKYAEPAPSLAQTLGHNAVSDLKDLATPWPSKMIDSAMQMAIGNPQGTVGSDLAAMGKGVAEPFVHPIDYAKEHPVNQALNLGLLFAPTSGPESGVKNFADSLASDSHDTLASINKKMANIPENATKMEGFKEPIPSQPEVDQATQNVISAYKQVAKEHGDILNAAKEEAGLPASKEDMDFSLRRYGNQFGLNVNKPLEVPSEVSSTLKPGDTVTVPSPDGKLPDVQLKYKGPMIADSPESLRAGGMSEEDITRATQPSYDLGNDIPGHPARSTLSDNTLKDMGYKTPDVNAKTMPYSIGDHNTPEQLNTEINRFKENLPYITKADQVKAASYFQDQIQQQGVFKSDIAKGPVMGRLKGQYGDLADLIHENSPTLQAAKSKWADFKNSLDLVDSKIDPERPGLTQSNLKRMFLSNSPATQDQLKQLAYFEQMTGKPVVTDLFKKFAGQSFSDLVSRPGREMLEAAGGLGAAALGHPLAALGTAGVLAAQSPRILGALESGVPAIAGKVGPLAALQAAKNAPFNQPFKNAPALQSMRDKMRNANAK